LYRSSKIPKVIYISYILNIYPEESKTRTGNGAYDKKYRRLHEKLFPEVVDDYISEENPVRFVDAFVDSLNLKELGFKHAELEDTGRPPYNPADLSKLYIYGYLNRIRSSRMLERECKRHLEVMWPL
jgi:transposase